MSHSTEYSVYQLPAAVVNNFACSFSIVVLQNKKEFCICKIIKHHTKNYSINYSTKMITLLFLLSLLANLTGLLGKWHESQMKTSSSLCESFGTDGRYNIQLMFASDGEAFIEVVKDPLFRREPSIQIECVGKQGKMRENGQLTSTTKFTTIDSHWNICG